MPTTPELIKEYREIICEEARLSERKRQLREAILKELDALKRNYFQSPHGIAIRTQRFSLKPKKDEVLKLLGAEDLFPFAAFTPKQVKERLVPKFGREALLPLFDIERKPCLLVKAPLSPEELANLDSL